MATAVAMEMEEKRRAEEWAKMDAEAKERESMRVQKEADDLQREAERSELSLDELTTLRQLEARFVLVRFFLLAIFITYRDKNCFL